MKIEAIKELLAINDEWELRREGVRKLFALYKKQFSNPVCIPEVETPLIAERFLRALALLYGEDYDDANMLVDLHGNYGIYTVIYDRNINKKSRSMVGLRMSCYVETYDDSLLTEHEVSGFIQESHGPVENDDEYSVEI